MTYGRSFGRPGFLGPEPLLLTTTRLGRPNDAAVVAESRRAGSLAYPSTKPHGGSVKPAWILFRKPVSASQPPFPACSYHVVPLGAWSAQFACPLCGGPREEVIGRIE